MESSLFALPHAADDTAAERLKKQDDACVCSLCHEITKQVILCMWGHSCCPVCETKLRMMDNACCPECRTYLLDESPANPRLLELLEFRRPCRNDGCPLLVLIAAPAQHEDACGFREVACPNAAMGCTKRVLANTAAQHNLDCLFNEVVCPYAGCTAPPMFKRDLPAHLIACLHRPWSCPFCASDAATLPQGAVLGHFKNVHRIDTNINANIDGALPLIPGDRGLRYGMLLRHREVPDIFACVSVSHDPDDAYTLGVKAFRCGAAVPTFSVRFELTPQRALSVSPQRGPYQPTLTYVVRSGSAPLVLQPLTVLRDVISAGRGRGASMRMAASIDYPDTQGLPNGGAPPPHVAVAAERRFARFATIGGELAPAVAPAAPPAPGPAAH